MSNYGKVSQVIGPVVDVSFTDEGAKLPEILSALEMAIKASVLNIKGFDRFTKTVIACDVSGSMMTPVSGRSKIQAYDDAGNRLNKLKIFVKIKKAF